MVLDPDSDGVDLAAELVDLRGGGGMAGDRRRRARVREWMRVRDRGPVSGEREWIRGGCGETGGLHASQAAQYQAKNPSVNSTRPKFFGCRLVPKSPKSKNFGLQSKRGLKPHRIDRISAV